MARVAPRAVAETLPVLDVSGVFKAVVRPTPRPDDAPIARIDFVAIDRAVKSGDGGADADVRRVARELADACERVGFFNVTGYPERQLAVERSLDAAVREFFRLPEEEKLRIPMSQGGRAWRGYFPVGGELTSGKPDLKEGIYFGQELPSDHPAVARGVPLHGPNLFPERPAELGPLVVEYMQHCALLGHVLMALLAAGLGLPTSRYFADALIRDHLALFRAFHYPPRSMLPPKYAEQQQKSLWGVGEHTDYGLLTLLKQDDVGGLEVRSLDGTGWIPVPPRPATLVVNIGDTLESITGGLLRSTPHRVRNPSSDAMRVSLPYFFDPGFDATIERAPLDAERRQRAERNRAARAAQGYTRWDNEAEPTVERRAYGEYLVSRVAKVFPQLAAAKL